MSELESPAIDELSPAEVANPPQLNVSAGVDFVTNSTLGDEHAEVVQADAPPAPADESATVIDIMGETTTLGELRKLKDPVCECDDDGLRVVGRQLANGKMRFVRSPCQCVVRSFLRKRAVELGAPIVVDGQEVHALGIEEQRIAKAAAAREKWRDEKLGRLVGQLEKEQVALAIERGRAAVELADRDAAVAGIISDDSEDAKRESSILEDLAAVDVDIDSVGRQIAALEREREALLASKQMGQDAKAAVQATRAERRRGNAKLLQAVEDCRSRNAAREVPLVAAVEKVQRRITEHKIRHPNAVMPAPAPAEAAE